MEAFPHRMCGPFELVPTFTSDSLELTCHPVNIIAVVILLYVLFDRIVKCLLNVTIQLAD